MENQQGFEGKSMQLYNKDEKKGVNYLTEYRNPEAMHAFELAEKLLVDSLKEQNLFN